MAPPAPPAAIDVAAAAAASAALAETTVPTERCAAWKGTAFSGRDFITRGGGGGMAAEALTTAASGATFSTPSPELPDPVPLAESDDCLEPQDDPQAEQLPTWDSRALTADSLAATAASRFLSSSSLCLRSRARSAYWWLRLYSRTSRADSLEWLRTLGTRSRSSTDGRLALSLCSIHRIARWRSSE